MGRGAWRGFSREYFRLAHRPRRVGEARMVGKCIALALLDPLVYAVRTPRLYPEVFARE
jgi:hypothetical protein